MIHVTRFQGTEIVINAELIERIEATPDCVITLVSGARYVVAETVDEIVEKVLRYRADLLRTTLGPHPAGEATTDARLHLFGRHD